MLHSARLLAGPNGASWCLRFNFAVQCFLPMACSEAVLISFGSQLFKEMVAQNPAIVGLAVDEKGNTLLHWAALNGHKVRLPPRVLLA